MENRDQIINGVMMANNISRQLAEHVVMGDGSVDRARLNDILAGVSFGRSPLANADPGIVDALITVLKEARERNDMPAVIRLRGRLTQLGVPNPGYSRGYSG